jgi:hypothetical protein
MTLSTFLTIVTGVLLNALAQLPLKAGVAPLGPSTSTRRARFPRPAGC